MKKIDELLNNKENHYLFPFFWQHGESHEVIKEYIYKMLEQGIHNMCIESRPHPDFLGNGWWDTMDFIIQEAKKNDMKIWILDDIKFPTGYANGKVPQELKKRYLDYHRFDIVGTNREIEINLTCLSGKEALKDKKHIYDKIVKIVLVKNDLSEKDAFFEEGEKDITSQVKDGILHLSLEYGHYSIFALYETFCGQEETTNDYLDPMNSRATQILIDEVYEKHYQHYKQEFGKTIVAFFSDEPRFGNVKGSHHVIGKSDMPLPWNEEVYRRLLEKINTVDLIYLFKGNSEKAHRIRFEYMNIVSMLYSENFSQYIGNWCEKHGVKYVGHIIEDNNAHARLGYGPGHYFRAMKGQHLAGIDIIGGQVVPGMHYYHDAFSTGGSDGEFYHYGLVNMGASCAKLDNNKKGVLMCEAFGAYGWVEGLKMMKWITDHMLSHGVNVIVPHAFDPSDFPDFDCPPHFYAHGNNPQYPYFHKWVHYADRLCHLLRDGYKYAKVGVLYHAFAEWSGECMYMQKVLKQLQSHQISCDILSEDYLLDAHIKEKSFEINGFDYEVLVVPYAQRLPQNLLLLIEKLNQHANVIFINQVPDDMKFNGKCIDLSELSQELVEYKDMYINSIEESLVCYKYIHDDGEVFMFTNEDITKTIKTTVSMKNDMNYMIYDAYVNRTYKLEMYKNQFDLVLEPYQSLILVSGNCTNQKPIKKELIQSINEVYISKKSFQESNYSKKQLISLDTNLSKLYPLFSGNIKYTFDITVENTNVILSIKEAYEIVEVFVNGQNAGCSIVPPYNFDISKYLKKSNNNIEIIVTNNLSRNQRDNFSMFFPLEGLGIKGTIDLYAK